MYYVTKQMKVKTNSFLDLDYPSRDKDNRAYDLVITVHCKNTKLNPNGMIVDFDTIEALINKLDGKNINELIPFNPTVENLAKYLCHTIPHCYHVEVDMGNGDTAEYKRLKSS